MAVHAEPLERSSLVHLPAPDQILEPISNSLGGRSSFRALSRSSCVSRLQARKLATSLAASRTRPSVIFIRTPNDLRSSPRTPSPPTVHFRPRRFIRTFVSHG